MAQPRVRHWQARSEEEMNNALEVLYEMATGYVLGELRQTAPDVYATLCGSARKQSQLINNVRYSMDTVLSEIITDCTTDNRETEPQ